MTVGLVLGMALRQAWTASTMFDAPTLFSASLLMADSDLSIQYLVSALVFGGCLLAYGLTDRTHIRFYTSACLHGPAAFVACAGTLLLVLPIQGSAWAVPVEVVSGVLTGFGTSMLTLAWATCLARRPNMHSIVICAILGTTLGFALYYVLLRNLAFPAGGLVISVIPLLEFLLLIKAYPQPFDQNEDGEPYFTIITQDRFSLFRNMGLPTILFGFALGILRVNAVQLSSSTTTSGDLVTMLWMLVPCAVALGMAAILSRQQMNSWASAIRVVALTIVASSFVLSLFAFSGLIPESTIIVTNWMCLEGFVWVLYASIAQYFRISPVYIYGCLRGLIAYAGLLGALIPHVTDVLVGEGASGSVISTIFIPLVLFLLGATLFPSTLRIGSQTASTASGLATPDEVAEVVTQEVAAAEEAAVAAAQEEAREAAAKHADPWTASPSTEEEKRRNGKFSRQVKRLAKTYMLTERETDVLFELAKGQSPSYIQEKLHISNGTVKTHTRHIYNKLDIHKRQEIYERLQEMEELDDE